MLKYFINSFCFLWISSVSFAQNETIDTSNKTSTESIIFQDKYGLRFGVDLSKFGRTAFETDYSGFEVNADYRLRRRLYVAGELGFEEKTTKTDYLDSSAKGNYFKAGIDYNLYNNWYGTFARGRISSKHDNIVKIYACNNATSTSISEFQIHLKPLLTMSFIRNDNQ